MSETLGGSGAEAKTAPAEDFEHIIGVSQKQLDKILRREKFYSFWLGQAFSDMEAYERNRQEAISRMDSCSQLFGLNAVTAAGCFVEDASDSSGFSITKKELTHVLTAKKSVGALYFSRALSSLDIEGDEFGYVRVGSLQFQIGERVLMISAGGDFWTERPYKHPQTGEPFWPSEKDVYKYEGATGNELEPLDSEVSYALDFHGSIERL